MSTRSRVLSLSPDALDLVADRFRVLAEPQRLRILQLLHDGEKNVTELTDSLQTTQPNVSKHLRMLQEAGLVGRRQAGNTVYCFIADPTVFDLCDLVCTSLSERVAAHAQLLAGTGRKRR
ncbi:MAG TPA: metalloregulator ArsR/SmtB family transcription factor [Thermoanaerobaculia bacterium]|jgi:ArsR family transcriptional regulator|nr:metalloregulator ArsR/SmtB family transcription factor [Thermoanaerobaculia bacterium]